MQLVIAKMVKKMMEKDDNELSCVIGESEAEG